MATKPRNLKEAFPPWLDKLDEQRSLVYANAQRRIAGSDLIKPLLEVPFEHLTKTRVKKQFDSDPSKSANTKNTYLTTIVSCINDYVKDDILPYNPLDKMRKWGHEASNPRVPRPGEIDRVCDEAEQNDPDKILVFDLCIELGCRIGEILDTGVKPPDKYLMWEHCDLDRSPPLIKLWSKKSGKSAWICSEMPIREEMAEKLRVWRSKNPDATHVFPWTYDTMYRWLKRCCKKVGVAPFSFHAFRHFFSHHLSQNGVADKKIQLALRHKSITTTQKYLRSLEPAHDLTDHLYTRNGAK